MFKFSKYFPFNLARPMPFGLYENIKGLALKLKSLAPNKIIHDF